MDAGKIGLFTLRSSIQYLMKGVDGTEFQRDCAPDHQQASFVAQVRWDDVGLFIIDMLGSQQNIGNRIRRWAPQIHPFLPNHYCIGCKLQKSYGVLSNDPLNQGAVHYDYSEVLCTFAPLPYLAFIGSGGDAVIDSDATNPDGTYKNNELLRYVERKSGDKGEAITYLGQFKFASDNAPIPTPPAVMAPYRELLYIWYYVPDPILNFLAGSSSYYGCVNSVPFDRQYESTGPPVAWPPWNPIYSYNTGDIVTYLGQDWIALSDQNLDNLPTDPSFWSVLPTQESGGVSNGTILYTGLAQRERLWSPLGNINWKLTLSFLWRPQGWNNAFRPNRIGINPYNTNGWEAVVNSATGLPPYRKADLNQLFKLFNPYPAPV